MNIALKYEDLPTVEREVADLYVKGYTKKEIASLRNRSIRTVENQIRKLFEKTEVRKDTEFASWYFVTRFHITFDLSPIKRGIVSAFLLGLVGYSIIVNDDTFVRVRSIRARTSKIERTTNRRNDFE